MIRFEQVSKRHPDGTTAVDGLSFEVNEGELVTLAGPSGCGKTTTMMMVNRLIEPASGQIHVNGEDVMTVDPVRLRRRIGYVIQQVGLFPHRTILDNTATVPTLVGWKRAKARARAAELTPAKLHEALRRSVDADALGVPRYQVRFDSVADA